MDDIRDMFSKLSSKKECKDKDYSKEKKSLKSINQRYVKILPDIEVFLPMFHN